MATTASALEHYLLGLINATRTDAGLSELTMELNLNQSSNDHSQWMSDTLTFSHTGVGGSSSRERMEDAGANVGENVPRFIGWGTAENIAAHSSYQNENDRPAEQAQLIHTSFMNSPGHRANIMDPDYTHVGLGIIYGPMDFSGTVAHGYVVTQNFAHSGVAMDEDLRGTTGNDALTGKGGDDFLTGLAGNDTLDGAGGNDTAVVSGSMNSVSLERVTDGVILNTADGRDTFLNIEQFRFDDGTISMADLVDLHLAEVTQDGDVWTGTNNNDDITATIAAETISGGQGNDTIDGKAGNDVINGGNGDDLLKGGKGDDVLRGGEGVNKMVGQKGNDHLIGGSQKDILNGGGNMDTLEGNGGDDFLKGGTRADDLKGGAGNDNLNGNRHNDTLDAGAGDDRLNGGGDNDRLIGGAGNDTMKGGVGADTFVYSDGADLITDYVAGEDMLELDSALVGADVTAVLDQLNTARGQTILDFGGGNVLTLDGTFTAAQLAGDIEFF